MTKRQTRLLLIVVLALTTGLLVLVINAPKHHINKASFERIKEGMSKQDIEMLLGIAPGMYCDGSVWVNIGPTPYEWRDTYIRGQDLERFADGKLVFGEDTASYCWISTTGAIWVVCDANDVMLHRNFYEVDPQSFWDRFQLFIYK